MDLLRPEPMTDAMIDREIAAALRVEPSPAFVPRVRQRIADEPVPSAWRVSWGVGAATAVAIAVVAAVAVRIDWSGLRGDVTGRDEQPRPSALIESRAFAGMSDLQPDRRSRPVPRNEDRAGKSFSVDGPSAGSSFVHRLPVVHGSSVVSGISRTEPEILIDVSEANALRALFAGASLGTVDLIPLASAAAKAASELTPPPEIVIAPLVNERLTPMPGEGARP
jgi:hypothetical protein